MRTKGKLLWGKYGKIMPQNRPDGWGHPLSLSGVALASGGPDEEADDNSKHLLACWNAIESIGGDPETVGELREALNNLCLVADCIRATGEIPIENEWGELNAARAILAKTKVEL